MASATSSTTGATSSWCRRCSAPHCCWDSSGTPATGWCACWSGACCAGSIRASDEDPGPRPVANVRRPGPRDAGAARRRSRGRRARVRLPARTVGLRQVDAAEHRRRLPASFRRRGAGGRAARHRARRRPRRGVPGVRALPVAHGGRQRPVRPHAEGGAGGGADQAGLSDQVARGARPLRARVHPLRERAHPRGEGRGRQGARVRPTRILALLGVLAVWAAVSYGNRALGVMMPALLPTPGDVGTVFAETARDGTLWRHVVTSLGRVAVGFGAAAVAALALGLLAAMCVPVRLMLEPIIEFVRPIPPLAFLPMFLVWFGLGEASKVAFIGYTTFFPMF